MSSKTIWIINQYASTLETGMGGRHYYFAQELAKLGYKVYLIASGYHHLLTNPPVINKKFHICDEQNFNFVWVKMPRYDDAHSKKRILNWFIFSWKIGKLARVIADKPDVILCSSPSVVSFLGSEKLARKFKCRLVFDVRDIWPLTLIELGGYSANNPFVRFLQWIENKAYKVSDHVISNWPYAVEHMVKNGLKREKFTWIPNGFSIEEFNTNNSELFSYLDKIPKGKFIVGYAGTIGTANALDVLLDAASLLKYNNDIAFVIVGGGKEEDKLIKDIKERELDNVYFLGAISKSQIPSALSSFDVCYVGFHKSPIYRYGNSLNKLPEYFASKKPIIYSIDSPFKPVDDAGAGITVQAEEPDKIVAAIIEIKKLSPEQRAKLGENGYRYALKNHQYGVLVTKLVDVLFEDGNH